MTIGPQDADAAPRRSTHLLSVVIATRDRAASLSRALESLVRQQAPGGAWEVVVVDNGSRDDTHRVLERFARALPLVVLEEPRAGKNRALNRALSSLRGELLVFTDDDVVAGPDWLANLVAASRRWPDAAVFGGPIEPEFPLGTPDWVQAPDFVLASEAFGCLPRAAEGPGDRLPFGANLAIRARIFEGIRFDETIGPGSAARYAQGSEYELLTRLRGRGERFVHVPDAPVRHVIEPHQVELDWLYARAERVGRGSARIKRKRVPKTVLGWIPLYLKLALARGRAHRARGLDASERFRIAQRVHYWRGYIPEAPVLRSAQPGIG